MQPELSPAAPRDPQAGVGPRTGSLSLPVRPRRLRRTLALRRMVREHTVRVDQLIYPLFVVPGKDIDDPIDAMPGVRHLSVDRLEAEVSEVRRLGIKAVLLFGLPRVKDPFGSDATKPDGAVPEAIRAIKSWAPDLVVMTDVCLCAYTDHGHCGVVEDGVILNDPSVDLLTRMAVAHAGAGADVVAPSDMMDGRIGAIRSSLDKHGLSHVAIMSYAAKYASSYYGPFRDAAHSAPQFGDRRAYQMDPANGREAIREVLLDVAEGADIVMVKPAMPYLDILQMVRNNVHLPVAAYQVSGEYSQIIAAADRGWLDRTTVMEESLLAIRRAGADLIITYFAKDYARMSHHGS